MAIRGSTPRRRRWPAVVLALVLAVAGVVVALYVLNRRTGDIHHPRAPFQAQKPPPRRHVRADTFVWPYYGYTAARTRYFPAGRRLGPPFRTRWHRRGRALLEFPPVIANGMLFVLDDSGYLYGVVKRTGRARWRRHLGLLAAASPAVGGGRVYVVLLERLNNHAAGRVVALSARSGRIRWAHNLPSRAESPPLLAGGSLYLGSEDGTVYALRARDGRTRWTYRAGGAVKGGPALARGVLYFGDYSGHVNAVRARNGRPVWVVGTSGAALGLSSGNFYSTAAVAFGRVYVGNTDGRVYSFAASSGQLAWAKQTGAYVYGSPAVADIPRLGPTVYIGSYDGNFYALDARDGGVRWTHPAGGKISGSATIVGRVVYYSNLAAKSSAGLDVRTGRPVFSIHQGAFNPVITDGRWIFLTGYGDLFALAPRRR